MQNKKLIALAVLGVAAVLSLIYGVSSGPKRAATGKSQPAVNRLPSVGAEAQGEATLKRRARRSSFATWSRSPFMPKSAKGSSYQMELSGILGSGNGLKAMINGQVVGKGDKIGSCVVTAVSPDRVTLNDGSKDIVLKLEQ